MKSNFTKAIGAGILTVSMTVLPLTLPASAQNNTDTGATTAPTTTTDTATNNNDDGFDWGWLGLLGLIGLAGLAGKGRREEGTRYRDPNTAVGTTTRE